MKARTAANTITPANGRQDAQQTAIASAAMLVPFSSTASP
jgi:hypothetical protein